MTLIWNLRTPIYTPEQIPKTLIRQNPDIENLRRDFGAELRGITCLTYSSLKRNGLTKTLYRQCAKGLKVRRDRC